MNNFSKSREEKVKQLRLIEIDKMIRSGNYPNVPAMQKEFEVSRATIMRDLEFLRDRYNAPLEYDYDKRGYYYTDETFFVQSVMLSESELFSLSVIQPLLTQYKNTPLETSMKNVFSKITEMLPNDVSVNTSFLGNDISFIGDPLPQIDEEIFTKVFSSMRTKHTINFLYRSIKRTDYSEHTCDAYHVLCQKGNWYMLAFDHKYQEVRTFSLARIKDISIEKTSFKIQAGFKPENYFDPSFGVWNTDDKPVKVELLFNREIGTYIAERTWHETQQIKENEDGTIYLSFESNQFTELLNWILHFGKSVKVLNPPQLIEKLKAELAEISKKY
ncbi:MAG: WYL domain-containing protein [Treponemataceae bacterium]|nr:WYL domain-containing protein [Treponemataceae bacterium]